MPTTIGVEKLANVCRRYRRSITSAAWSDYVVIACIMTIGAWCVALWESSAIGSELHIMRIIGSAMFTSLVGCGMLAAMRHAVDFSSGRNFAMAIQFWNRGDHDKAFLILFDPIRPLAPILVKRPNVQALLREALRNAVRQTKVAEVRTNVDINAFLTLLDRAAPKEDAYSAVMNTDESRSQETSWVNFRKALWIAIGLNIIFALVKLLS